jgi:hypothetical protein
MHSHWPCASATDALLNAPHPSLEPIPKGSIAKPAVESGGDAFGTDAMSNQNTSHVTRHTSHVTRQSHSTCSVMISARVKGWPQDEEVEFVTQIACGTLHALAVSLHCHIFALCLLLLFLLCIIIVSIIIVITDHSYHYRHILHPFKRLHFACCDAAN